MMGWPAGSEIRLASSRDLRVLVGIVFMPVFGADNLPPFRGIERIGYGRGPRRREGALILDREMDLQVVAGVIEIERALVTHKLLVASFQRTFRGFVIEQRVAFHHVQGLGV